MRAAVVGLLTIVLCCGVAFASPPKPRGKGAKAKAYKPKPQRIKFGDDVVRAGPARGEGGLVQVRGKTKHSHLIVVRMHFVPEMIKDADNI